MQTLTIGENDYSFRLNFTATDRMRSRSDSAFAESLDITQILEPGSRVPELLATNINYLLEVAQDMLIDQSQRDLLRDEYDGDSIARIYTAVTEELTLFSQGPRRAALKATLKHLETQMANVMNEIVDDEPLPVSQTSTGNAGELQEHSEDLTPEISLSAS